MPRWRELTSDGTGIIRLQVDEFRSPDKVAAAVQAATQSIILDDMPRFWPAVWNGSTGNKKDEVPPRRGLKALLMDEATYVNAPPTKKRRVMVAEIFDEQLARVADGEEPNPRRPTRLPDGTVWFRWRALWHEPIISRDVHRSETTALAERLGITDADYRIHPATGKGRKRYCVLTQGHLAKLAEVVADERRKENAIQETARKNPRG